MHAAPVGEVDGVAVRLVPDPGPHQTDEVRRRAGQLEADQVGAEQPLQQLAAPRDLAEQLAGRERDVQEEADPQVGPLLAQHLRDQLQLVVLHPDHGVLGGDLGGPVGEAAVDGDVRVPPLAVELRRRDDVVVQRPQGGVGEALVVVLDLVVRQRHRHQRQARVLERLHLVVGTVPADPGPGVVPHHRLERRDQSAGRGLPDGVAVVVLGAVDGEAVGHHDQVGLRGVAASAGHRSDPSRSRSGAPMRRHAPAVSRRPAVVRRTPAGRGRAAGRRAASRPAAPAGSR